MCAAALDLVPAGTYDRAMKTPRSTSSKAPDRKDRLKAALKANMGRRKAQARARAAVDQEGETGSNEQKE